MKSINQSAPVQCTKSISIQASPQKVWTVLTDINNWATWQKDIKQPVLNGALIAGSTFNWKTGGAKIQSTLHTVQLYEEFGWTGKTFGMFAVHNWILNKSNTATEVVVRESMDGLLAKLFKKSFNKNLEKGMQHWLDLLKTECEKKVTA